MTVHESVAQFIQRHNLLQPNQRVVLGVSGGADSVCLMDCLHQLGYDLIIAHLDHGLREESPQEAVFVRTLAEKYGYPAEVVCCDVKQIAEKGFSLEEAGRIARYRFLVQVANSHGIHTIATGHTADDQVETVLMHLIRGAGSAGLRGILPKTKLDAWAYIPDSEGIELIRPLLTIHRQETIAHCQEIGIVPRTDPSNRDPSFLRNRIRSELLPSLESYNPGIRQVILRTAEVMREEKALIESLVDRQWDEIILATNTDSLMLDRRLFSTLPEALQREFLRRAIIRQDKTLRDLSYKMIDRAIQFNQEGGNSGTIPLSGGLEWVLLPEAIYIQQKGTPISFPDYPQMNAQDACTVEVPSELPLANGWVFTAARERLDSELRNRIINGDPRTAALDAANLQGELVLRTPQEGDRIQPLGMEGSKKVADIFIDAKIPKRARKYWPLLTDHEVVIWVVGLRIAHAFRIRARTTETAIFCAVPPEETS